MSSKRDTAKLAGIGAAGIVAAGVFAYLQLSTTTVYVAEDTIYSNTQITEELLTSGVIKAKSVPKSIANSASVKKFEDIEGKYLKYPLGPGKPIFTYDMAGESDIRNNTILRDQGLEALTIRAESMLNDTKSLSTNDRINIYSVEKVNLKTFSDSEKIAIGQLPADLKKIFMDGGKLLETDEIAVGTYQYSKLIAQNIPVIEVLKDKESNNCTGFVVGVTSNMSENLYLSLETGKIGFNILPYSEKDYKVKESNGMIQNLQFVGNNDVDSTIKK